MHRDCARSWCSNIATAFTLLLALVVHVAAQEPASENREFAERTNELRESAIRTPEPRVIIGNAPEERAAAPIFPWKKYIVSAVFSIGDKDGANGASAWDPEWQKHYGGFDDPNPKARRDFSPLAFRPGLNPFYVALPYNDVADGRTKAEAREVIPWFSSSFQREGVSVCKDRWIAIQKGDRTCYAQWSDSGPHRSDHWKYVFGDERPTPNPSQGAGLLVSPAVRDYLGLSSKDVINWKFVELRDVPQGPWAKFGENNPFVRASGGLHESGSGK
ncbi:hypothetical protein ACXR0O_22160 [Verrucomicrobiota bacterium sgz303538]